MESAQKAVEHLVEGDLVDLASCPYLKDSPIASCEYGQVAAIERETDDCIAVIFENANTVGYPVGTLLSVCLPPLPHIDLGPGSRNSKYQF